MNDIFMLVFMLLFAMAIGLLIPMTLFAWFRTKRVVDTVLTNCADYLGGVIIGPGVYMAPGQKFTPSFSWHEVNSIGNSRIKGRTKYKVSHKVACRIYELLDTPIQKRNTFLHTARILLHNDTAFLSTINAYIMNYRVYGKTKWEKWPEAEEYIHNFHVDWTNVFSESENGLLRDGVLTFVICNTNSRLKTFLFCWYNVARSGLLSITKRTRNAFNKLGLKRKRKG